MVKINFKQFQIKESPFHEEYGGKGKPINVRLESDALKLLEGHFKDVYDKDAMTKGIRSIIYDYLDRICLKKRVFHHLEAVMIIPKTDDIDKIETQSQIIAVINTESDFNNNFNHNKGFYADSGAIFELKEFNWLNFNYTLEMFKNTIDSCVYKTSKEDFKSFDSFKQKQAEIYPDLDLDDCYFVRFPLNNYMDNINYGKSVHYKSWKNNHLGGYVLTDAIPDLKKFLLIDWYYLSEISSQIQIDFQFVPEDFFVDCALESSDFDSKHDYSFYDGDDDILKSMASYFDGDYRQSYLKNLEAELTLRLSFVRDLLKDDD